MLQYFPQCFQVLPVDPGSSTQHARDMKRSKTPSEIVAVIAKLFDLYGLDRRPDRDRSRDGERFEMALYCAVRDRLLKLPLKRGAPAKWKGKLGLDLVNAVEAVRNKRPTIPAYRVKSIVKSGRQPTIEDIKSFVRPMSVSKALEVVEKQSPNKFKGGDLEKRYYEARKAWPLGKRLMTAFDL
jgi:hypothetical protein